MTQQQFEGLAQFEDQFRTAIKWNYVRLSPTDAKKMVDLYNEIANEKVSYKACSGCGGMKTVQMIGKLYFKEKEAREKNEEVPDVPKNKTQKEKTKEGK